MENVDDIVETMVKSRGLHWAKPPLIQEPIRIELLAIWLRCWALPRHVAMIRTFVLILVQTFQDTCSRIFANITQI